MVLAEFTIAPTGKGESLSKYVAPVIDIIDKSGITYLLTPMGTIIEGSWREVMAVIEQCFNHLQQNHNRIGLSVKLDYRKGNDSRMQSKISKVEALIGRTVHHS